jgi:hypothetical protein
MKPLEALFELRRPKCCFSIKLRVFDRYSCSVVAGGAKKNYHVNVFCAKYQNRSQLDICIFLLTRTFQRPD